MKSHQKRPAISSDGQSFFNPYESEYLTSEALLKLVGLHPRVLLIVLGLALFGYGTGIGTGEEPLLIGRGFFSLLFTLNGVSCIAWAIMPSLGWRFGAAILGWSMFGYLARAFFLTLPFFTEPPFWRGVGALVAMAAMQFYLWPTLAVGMEVEKTNKRGE